MVIFNFKYFLNKPKSNAKNKPKMLPHRKINDYIT